MNAAPRPITEEVLTDLYVWTMTADMFMSSPQGAAFGAELREVFKLAAQRLDQIRKANAASEVKL